MPRGTCRRLISVEVTMRRRHFVASVLGTALLARTTMAHNRGTHSGHLEDQDKDKEKDKEKGKDESLSTATVSFGAWPQFDRLAPLPIGTSPPNIHRIIPETVNIKRGGSVNFLVAGFHKVLVYGPPKRVEDVAFNTVINTPGAPVGFPGIIEDPVNRVFRGAVNFNMLLDRVEVVYFPNKGLHLVICGFSPHFNASEKMFGWVDV